MGLSELQLQITQNSGNAVESVDLLKLAHNVRSRGNKTEQLKLAVDGECCLDRLYGGYFPDWVCGGQWNKMEQFLRNFAAVVQGSSLDLVVFLNGSLEQDRIESDWKKRQEETYKFIEEIHKHVTSKKKPPPKVWWVPPAYLHTAVRLAFRSLQMKTMCTLEDHHKEIVRFCQRNGFQGLVADDAEYLVFDIQRYFSAQKLKLTFKGSLETVEVKLKKVFDSMSLPKDRFHIFAALLGNHILLESDLTGFHSALGVDALTKANLCEKVAEFTKDLPQTEIDKVAEAVIKTMTEKEVEVGKDLVDKITKCLRYYSDLTVPKTANAGGKGEKKGKNKASKKAEQKGQKTSATAPVQAASSADTGNSSLPSDTQKLEGDSSKVFADGETEGMTNGNGEVDTTMTASDQSASKSTLDKLLYRVNPEIENVCSNRHKNGLMSPYIYHIFKHKEIKLPALIQEAKDQKELPRAHELFRPLRQRVYAILFNLHHLQFLAKQRNEKVPTIQVKETFYCPKTKMIKSELVQAHEVGWGVPTVERLWLGEKEDCKRKRTRAWLTIMKADKPVVLDSTIVPQQMLVLTCVLRYILASEKKVLRKHELEAFIAQAFIQDMTDPSIAQDIEVTNLTMRGVHLSHLFMEGIEMALLSNDACGAPIPYMLFCPWLFFNGKVFNYVLEQQALGKSLAEICGYKMDLVFNIDQLRLAATEGIKVQYAPANNPTPFLFANNAPLMNQIIAPPSRGPYMSNHPHLGMQGPASLSQLAAAAAGNRNRLMGHPAASLHANNLYSSLTGVSHPAASIGGLYGNYPGAIAGGLQGRGGVPLFNDIPGRQRRAPPRNGGGQLEVAGMVVGSWGANYGPNPNFSNAMAMGGRNVRVPMGPGPYVSQSMQVSSLFDQMRISGGKVPNSRPSTHGGGPWYQQRKTIGKSQKKTATGKKNDNQSKTGGGTSGSAKASNANKSKGGSKDETKRTETAGDSSAVTVENGSVDAAPSTNANESSLSGGKVEEVKAE